MKSTLVFVIDDDPSIRKGLGRMLRLADYETEIFESASDFLARPRHPGPCCVIVDVQMPGLNGLAFQEALLQRRREEQLIFITGHGDIATTVQAMKTGAEDFLTKPVSKETLIDAIERALRRYQHKREQDSRVATLRSLYFRLTPREREVFALLVRGKPHKQIAFALGTSERTIKLHRHNVMQKFQVQSLAELAVSAERLGLLPFSECS